MWGWYFLIYLYLKNEPKIGPKMAAYGSFLVQLVALVQFFVIKKSLWDIRQGANAVRTCPMKDFIDLWMTACLWIGVLSMFFMFAFGSRYGSPGDAICYRLLRHWNKMKALHDKSGYVNPDDPDNIWQKNPHLSTAQLHENPNVSKADIEDREALSGKFIAKWLTPQQAVQLKFRVPKTGVCKKHNNAWNDCKDCGGGYKFYTMPDEGQYGDLERAEYLVMHGREARGDEAHPVDRQDSGFILAEFNPADGWKRSQVTPARVALTSKLPLTAAFVYFLLDAALNVFGCFITFFALKYSCIDVPSPQLRLMMIFTGAYLLFTSIFICSGVASLYASTMGLQHRNTYEAQKKHEVAWPKEIWANKAKGFKGCNKRLDECLP